MTKITFTVLKRLKMRRDQYVTTDISVMCVILLGFWFLNLASCQDLTPTADVKILSELPLDRLLEVKKSLLKIDKIGAEIPNDVPQDKTPSALALKKSNTKRGDYEDEKGYNIQSIFQTSVTALAFLAFGGYLVCLITQSIKGHQNPNQVIVMESLMKRPLRIKAQRPTRYRNSKKRRPNHRLKREVWPNIDLERLYEALVMLSEGYAKHHVKRGYIIKDEL